LINNAPLLETNFSDLSLHGRGKVRDIYRVGDDLLIVATDRISAFDYVLGSGIPDKGKVLTQLSAFWFERMGDLVPHHVIATDVAEYPAALQPHAAALRGRSMLCRRTRPLPIECVARGYLSGSGWKEYQQTGMVCGVKLPAGLKESDRLPEPIFTPATKAESGHDINISEADAAAIVGRDVVDRVKALTLEIFRRGCEHAESKGIIIADTKFEFGLAPASPNSSRRSASGAKADGSSANLIGDDEIVLIDEVLTPDSSRFWPRDEYRPGGAVPSFDKQFVRDYL
jgi:phosphoribosylaminoimidazole-succinocarboxamide synthase